MWGVFAGRSRTGAAVVSPERPRGRSGFPADMGLIWACRSSAQLGIDRVRERAKRREMIVRRRQLGDSGRRTEALASLPALDSTRRVSERFRDGDVVILALRDMKDLLLLEAVSRLSSAIVSKEQWIGLAALGLVHGDAVVERVAERV